MKRRFRLTRSSDFVRVRRTGKSYADPLVVLITVPSADSSIHVGITAGRSVGNAVQRNRAKRQLRSCMDQLLPFLLPEHDIVLIARKPILQADFSQICMAVQHLLARAGVGEKSNA
ncbi:MAG: ribonuclease P protein component [Chloroflexi bacterium]|nr:ribonuclease P protein component [Anaerolineaceae bacterium]NMB87519.1 ribonuclease P protein component [Chloroflexota bacterium]